jgi:hypothetical protein
MVFVLGWKTCGMPRVALPLGPRVTIPKWSVNRKNFVNQFTRLIPNMLLIPIADAAPYPPA